MACCHRGDMVEFDGLLAAVVGVSGDPGVPEDHVVLWFGAPDCKRKSQGGQGGCRPELWTVPAEHIIPAAKPVMRH